MMKLIEQARLIHDTVQLIKQTVIKRISNHGEGGPFPLDLTIPQVNALLIVSRLQHVSIKELAAEMHVSAPSASAMVDRLVEIGVVSREPSKSDRREVVVQLTELGARHTSRIEEAMLQWIMCVLEKIGPKYAQMWCDVYEKIREVLPEMANAVAEGELPDTTHAQGRIEKERAV
jgi:DNA-binding MarR family transcriptional regulator